MIRREEISEEENSKNGIILYTTLGKSFEQLPIRNSDKDLQNILPGNILQFLFEGF